MKEERARGKEKHQVRVLKEEAIRIHIILLSVCYGGIHEKCSGYVVSAAFCTNFYTCINTIPKLRRNLMNPFCEFPEEDIQPVS